MIGGRALEVDSQTVPLVDYAAEYQRRTAAGWELFERELRGFGQYWLCTWVRWEGGTDDD